MKRHFSRWLSVVLAVVVIAAVALTGCHSAPNGAQPLPVAPVGADAVASGGMAPSGVPQEGIKVHGNWTIEVTNPDGTLAERREFENALNSLGAKRMCQILARDYSTGGWNIELSSSILDESPFLTSANQNAPGEIVESSYSLSSEPYYFKNLTVSVPLNGINIDKLVLSGTATAQRNGKIGIVSTKIVTLPNSVPSNSYEGNINTFTQFILSDVVNLTTGQQIVVTVVISFS